MYDWHTSKRSPTPEKEEKDVDDVEDSKEEEEEDEGQFGDSGDNHEEKDDQDKEVNFLHSFIVLWQQGSTEGLSKPVLQVWLQSSKQLVSVSWCDQ